MLHPLLLAALAYNAALHDPIAPPGYVFLYDRDGSPRKDWDGAYQMEPA